MDIMNEIDRLIASIEAEKDEKNVQPEAVPYDNQPSDYDPDFLDSILNEMDGGDVSKLNDSDNVHLATASPSIPTEQPAQLEFEDTTNLSVDGPGFLAKQLGTSDVPSIPVVTVSYQLNDQQMIILPANSFPSQNIPLMLADAVPLQQLLNSSNAVPSANAAGKFDEKAAELTMVATRKANPQGSRKRKLYEEEEFSDPELEKKRQNAINAKKHRTKTKETIEELQKKLNSKEQECDALEKMLKEQQSAYNREIADLRKTNEDLMHKLKIWQHLMN